MPQCFIPHIAQIGYLDTTYRQLGIFPLVISFVAGLVLHRFREKIAWSSRLCFIMAALSLLLFSVPHGLRFAAVPSGYVTIYLRLLNPWRNKIILSGDYSYGLYLYGFPIQQAVVAIGLDLRRWYLNLAFAVPSAVLVAIGSWWLVEKPSLDQRKKLKNLEEWHLKTLPSIRTVRVPSPQKMSSFAQRGYAQHHSSITQGVIMRAWHMLTRQKCYTSTPSLAFTNGPTLAGCASP